MIPPWAIRSFAAVEGFRANYVAVISSSFRLALREQLLNPEHLWAVSSLRGCSELMRSSARSSLVRGPRFWWSGVERNGLNFPEYLPTTVSILLDVRKNYVNLLDKFVTFSAVFNNCISYAILSILR